MRINHIIFLVLLLIFNVNALASTDKVDVSINFNSIKKEIYISNLDKKNYRDEIIINPLNSIEKIEENAICSEGNKCIKIFINNTPNVKVKDFNIEVHANTLFINKRGIFFNDKVIIVGGDIFVEPIYRDYNKSKK